MISWQEASSHREGGVHCAVAAVGSRVGCGQKHKAGAGWGVVVGSNCHELRAEVEDGVRRRGGVCV